MASASQAPWAIVAVVILALTVYEGIQKHFTISETTFVFAASLLYFNFVWIIVTYTKIAAARKNKTTFLLIVSLIIGVAGWWAGNFNLAIACLAGLVAAWSMGRRVPVILLTSLVATILLS